MSVHTGKMKRQGSSDQHITKLVVMKGKWKTFPSSPNWLSSNTMNFVPFNTSRYSLFWHQLHEHNLYNCISASIFFFISPALAGNIRITLPLLSVVFCCCCRENSLTFDSITSACFDQFHRRCNMETLIYWWGQRPHIKIKCHLTSQWKDMLKKQKWPHFITWMQEGRNWHFLTKISFYC